MSTISTKAVTGIQAMTPLTSAFIAFVAVIALTCSAAFAGTDATFDTLNTRIGGYISGSGGELAAILALGSAIAGSVLQFNFRQVGGAVLVSGLAGLGLPIITGGITALV